MRKIFSLLLILVLGFGALVLGCGQQASQEDGADNSISGTVSWTGTTMNYLMVFIGTDPDFPFPDDTWITSFEAKVVTGTSESTYNFTGLSSGTYYVGAIGYVGNTFDEPTTDDKLGEYSDGQWPTPYGEGTPAAIVASGSDTAITGKNFTLGVTVQ